MSFTEELKKPFPESAISWRVGATNAKKLGCKPWEATKGIGLAYIDARDVMERLEEVCGDLYQVEYPFEGCCRIGIKIGEEWVWRSNGAGKTDVEGEKGIYSDSFKRAAVLWGVGRYLYNLPNVWFDLDNGKIKGNPSLPDWAKPTKPTKPIEYVTGKDLKMLRESMINVSAEEAPFCQFLKVDKLEKLPLDKLSAAHTALSKKAIAMQNAKEDKS